MTGTQEEGPGLWGRVYHKGHCGRHIRNFTFTCDTAGSYVGQRSPTFLAPETGFLGDSFSTDRMVQRRGEGGVRLEAWSLAGGAEGGWGSGVRGGYASGSNASEGSSSGSFAHKPPTPLQLCNRVLRGLPPPLVLGPGRGSP